VPEKMDLSAWAGFRHCIVQVKSTSSRLRRQAIPGPSCHVCSHTSCYRGTHALQFGGTCLVFALTPIFPALGSLCGSLLAGSPFGRMSMLCGFVALVLCLPFGELCLGPFSLWQSSSLWPRTRCTCCRYGLVRSRGLCWSRGPSLCNFLSWQLI
jgi:hypothetical protein